MRRQIFVSHETIPWPRCNILEESPIFSRFVGWNFARLAWTRLISLSGALSRHHRRHFDRSAAHGADSFSPSLYSYSRGCRTLSECVRACVLCCSANRRAATTETATVEHTKDRHTQTHRSPLRISSQLLGLDSPTRKNNARQSARYKQDG